MKKLLIAAVPVAAIIGWYYRPAFTGDAVRLCDAPSGAMDAIQYQEMFIPKLRDLKFSCVPLLHQICSAHLCTEFTAIDAEDKHVIGYVWRDVFNKPEAAVCSPDGGKEGSFYGECPVGTPVATIYKCPWCPPEPNAKPDLRGIRSSTRPAPGGDGKE